MPFNLTPKQAECVETLVAVGSVKMVAHELEMPQKTVHNHLRAAILKMGCDTYIQAALKWDRRCRDIEAFKNKPIRNSAFGSVQFTGNF